MGQKIAIREVYISTLTDTKVPASSKDLILVHTSTHITAPTSFDSENCGIKVDSSAQARLGTPTTQLHDSTSFRDLMYNHIVLWDLLVLL